MLTQSAVALRGFSSTTRRHTLLDGLLAHVQSLALRSCVGALLTHPLGQPRQVLRNVMHFLSASCATHRHTSFRCPAARFPGESEHRINGIGLIHQSKPGRKPIISGYIPHNGTYLIYDVAILTVPGISDRNWETQNSLDTPCVGWLCLFDRFAFPLELKMEFRCKSFVFGHGLGSGDASFLGLLGSESCGDGFCGVNASPGKITFNKTAL